MSAISAIEWTDRTWNPVRGCSVVSPGCVNCYAMKLAHRFSGEGRPYEGLTKHTKAGPQWTGQVRTIDDALLEPLSWRKPQRVFVNSMSDLFHEDVPAAFIDRVFAVMALAPRHTFQVLTKRPERMRAYLRTPNRQSAILDQAIRIAGDVDGRPEGGLLQDAFLLEELWALGRGWTLPNVWLGVSVEDQARADERIPLLLQTPAAVRFISAEPLLGPLDLRTGGEVTEAGHIDWLRGFVGSEPAIPGLDWVIVGGESGPGARPFHIEWARGIVTQCQAAHVPVFVKQLGADPRDSHWDMGGMVTLRDRKGGDLSEWPADLRVREFPR